MPRIVYGVLDVHRSHRIEIPDPARAAAAGRPDACSSCHVGGQGAGARAPLETVFTGDPVERAVAADALGRAPAGVGGDARPRKAALLEVMTGDRFPAVRHLAWRSLRRLAPPGTGDDYDPSAALPERARAVERLRAELGVERPGVRADSRSGRDQDLEIGE
jgi:hypothetical protein